MNFWGSRWLVTVSGGSVASIDRTALRYLSDPDLREQITQVTNRNEAFHGFADWLMFGGKLIGHNDPDYQEKIIKFNELPANCVIHSTACDITDTSNAIAAEGRPVDPDNLATISHTSPTSSAGSATGSSTSPRQPLPRPRTLISTPVSCSPHDRADTRPG
ncbi:Tn3 family transposase [Spirillospora sp. CA-108201]